MKIDIIPYPFLYGFCYVKDINVFAHIKKRKNKQKKNNILGETLPWQYHLIKLIKTASLYYM